ncbi:thioesterase domain-containing protein [Shewanella xiamenensis]|uniref:Thioesterase domain-containing protein n=1 Tax=Shewanella xiamenensis TaxID=332186 RepID=A0ABT6UCL8_9GAMM|nr:MULTISPECIES: thioesterase domain-containing protein [Shewanella]PZP34299.1 MAG: thioesterase [Shewanella oneidensis]MCT8864265.1 thioesterase domain-containing protein [Shewanella xiamenensis]MCT8868399.1 thioesterase domain-containing protein [Shewanella xiamenensis]MCT8876307.1 thioesterase domain-containing protein [Shewanella xiamenensis]MDI5832221.1 thioesterase domain-containing protein [Shewanella xiamenensis]
MDELLNQLRQTWHRTIPVSEFMQIAPLSFSDGELSVSAPLAPNINLHHTMFAGSIYTLMTLTGWGMVWLQQQLLNVDGDIVLADAHIRYLAPVDCAPEVKVRWPDANLSPLLRGRKAKVKLEVQLFCDEKLCAQFDGLYVSVPKM